LKNDECKIINNAIVDSRLHRECHIMTNSTKHRGNYIEVIRPTPV